MAAGKLLIEGYAHALFAVAEAEGDLERVEEELFRFGRTLEAEPGLREALTDPALPPERKRALLAELLGSKASQHTVNLLGFLVDQGRARDLSKIIDAAVQVAAERRAQAVAEVRTAVPLDAGRRDRLVKALGRATGKRVDLRTLVDPSVIGGVVARVGDQVFDGSVRHRLDEARERIGRIR